MVLRLANRRQACNLCVCEGWDPEIKRKQNTWQIGWQMPKRLKSADGPKANSKTTPCQRCQSIYSSRVGICRFPAHLLQCPHGSAGLLPRSKIRGARAKQPLKLLKHTMPAAYRKCSLAAHCHTPCGCYRKRSLCSSALSALLRYGMIRRHIKLWCLAYEWFAVHTSLKSAVWLMWYGGLLKTYDCCLLLCYVTWHLSECPKPQILHVSSRYELQVWSFK